MKSISAIITFRNEAAYLPTLIAHLQKQGCDIALIDHGSEDGSYDIAADHLGGAVHGIWTLPKAGAFNLTQQLAHKAQFASSLSHRWILHQDADEILHPQAPDQTLADIALEAEAAGTSAINFDEFVFLPPSNQSVREEMPHDAFLNYYFFEPTPKRLMRLWRKGAGLENLSGAGHHLHGNVRLFEQSQVLRHHIGRSH